MEGRVWPWKRKSSDKTTTEKPVVAAYDSVGVSLSSLASLENQEMCKNTNYVQITMESYTHMSRLGDRVKLLEDEVKDLKEKLSTAHSEIKTKESLILQHAKVAEEAVSGWEKADAETLALKLQLESVMLLKLTAEDRVLHLDDALKECTRQIRNVKDESEQRLHDVILAKTVQWDKTKAELEGQIDELNQGLLRAAADNAALSRSLQERSEMIIRISGEKSKADTEVAILKSNIQSYEKETSSLKYDLHVVSKELEIRNEEKNMSIKSAEMANRQHLEGVKKIAKLEAECQRLRGLVRKKLPGPAALAQMKLEVENSGYEFADPRSRRSGFQYPGHNAPPKPDISADKLEECKKDNTHFSRCMLEMEEETKTLKELLAARNSELQVSRNLCAKTVGKLKILEAQVEMLKHDKITPKSCKTNQSESPSSGHATYPPSATSISEDGFDEDGSSSEYGPPMSSDSNKVVVSRSINSSHKPETSNTLELMDDFLEIERLAASDADGAVSASNSSNSTCSSKVTDKLPTSDSEQDCAQAESSMENIKISEHDQLFSVIHSRIYKVFESQEGISVEKVIEAVTLAIQEVQESLSQQLSGCLIDISCIDAFPRAGDETGKEHSLLSQHIEHGNNVVKPTKQDLDAAISHIHHFIISVVKETAQLQEMHEQRLSESLDDFCASVGKFPTGESSLVDIVIKLSHILRLATDGALGFKHHSNESSAMDSVSECVDKVTLLEKRVDEPNLDTSGKIFIDRAGNPCSKEKIPHDNNGLDLDDTSCKSLLQELEQVKLEKDNVLLELERCLQKLESSKPELEEKEKLISELKTQLTSSRDLLGLAETQLKCVTESFKSLELRAEDLEAEVKRLQLRTEDLEVSLSEEKHCHACTLAVCKELQEKMQRNDTCRKCSSPISHPQLEDKQEKEIASAAEKLAACQETIHLLSQQLQALKPPTKSQSPEKLKSQVNSKGFSPELRDSDGKESINDILASTGHENSSDSASNDSDMGRSFRYRADSAQPVHAIIKSSSFSSSSKGENEKYTRGLGRFFSSKTKNGR